MATQTLPTKVETHIRRGNSSRYADEIKNRDFTAIRHVVVAQNTPQWFRQNAPFALDATLKGWERVPMNGDVMSTLGALDTGTDIMVWIKTATLGGRAKVYVRPLS